MNFAFSDEQEELRTAVRRFLAEKSPETEVRRLMETTEGYDPAYGARPMRRSIQRLIQDPLALKLLAGEFLAGETILVDRDVDTGKLKFSKQEAMEPVAARNLY